MDNTLDQPHVPCRAIRNPAPRAAVGDCPAAGRLGVQRQGSRRLEFLHGSGRAGLGLERAGFKVVVASGTDPDARATIAANRPDLPVLGDLRDYDAAEVRAAAGIGDDTDIDLVAAGPPCQTFSTAGKQGGTADERGDVLLKFLDLAIRLHPRYIAIENVRGLMLDKDAFDEVLRRLRGGGYATSFNLYDAVCFGAAQHRDRVIVIASRSGRVPYLRPTNSCRPEDGLPPWRTLRDAIGDMTGIEHHAARYPEWRLPFFRQLKPGQNWKDLPDPAKAISRRVLAATGGKSEIYRRLAWDRPSHTLLTKPCNMLSGCCHPDENRPLSVEEYRRLQGFPDRWQVCGSIQSQYRQLGNAVPVPLGEAVGKAVIQHIRTGRSDDPVPGFRYSRYRRTSDRDPNELQPQERLIMDNTFDTLGQLQSLCGQLGVPVPLPPPPPASEAARAGAGRNARAGTGAVPAGSGHRLLLPVRLSQTARRAGQHHGNRDGHSVEGGMAASCP